MLADEERINLILEQNDHYWVWEDYEVNLKKGDLGFLCTDPASLFKYLVEIAEDAMKYYLGGKNYLITRFKVIEEVEDKSIPFSVEYEF